MKIRIIADSCCDLREGDFEFGENINYSYVPLSLNFEDETFIDNKDVDVDKLLDKIKTSKKAGSSACPSPHDYYAEMIKDDVSFCVTLSKHLSGSYNSALLGKKEVEEKFPNKKIFVIDSLSASAGEILLVMKLNELIGEKKHTPEQIADEMYKYTKKMKTRFLINNFTNFVKSGRMSKFAAIIATALIIRPICGDNGEGEIKVHQKVIGAKKAQQTMAEIAATESAGNVDNPVVIAHCKNEPAANLIKGILEKVHGLKKVFIYTTKALSSFYACNEGLVLATFSQKATV